ncbi:MAG TPA: adenylate/guanylate cyclase domain-containing protein [Rhabdochlamydiaceae bacterium]|jgi:class 3 adenylate cyclase
MSLRYRLFLWISALFLLTAIVGSFTESFVTKRALKKAKESLCKKILESKEQVRANLQEFLSYQILENQAKIDVLLNTISYSSPQLVQFAPTLENLKQGTAMACVNLLQANRWLDFIQNTNEGTPTGIVVPKSPPFPHAYRSVIDSDLSWVFNNLEASSSEIYIGVRLFSIDQEYPPECDSSCTHVDGEEIEELPVSIPETYLLFPWKVLKDSPSFASTLNAEELFLSPPWIQGHKISLKPFISALERARLALLEGTLCVPIINKDAMRSKLGEEGPWEEMLINPFPNGNMLALLPKEKFLEGKVNDLSMRNGEINILYLLQALLHVGLFANNGVPEPLGIATFKTTLSTGPSAFLSSLFFSSQLFDDARYFAQYAPSGRVSNIATTLAIVNPDTFDRAFLGNTAQFIVKAGGNRRVGYLTLACDADTIIQQLVLTLNQAVFLVTGGKVASAFSDDGEKIHPDVEHSILVGTLLNQNVGLTQWQGKDFFFMHVTPFPSLDLHFFLFNPADKEFALLYSLEQGSQEVAKSIFLNIQLCGFAVLVLTIVVLHYFSKSVTAPIIQLAAAAKEVKEGRLDTAYIPVLPAKKKDEIATLCQSFGEMVQGLKEKEKVKGILNKVVSQEIAQEILSGQVHLGGEEKRVSVLFADIRNFTGMTQSMQPHEVIDLLNTCMTKISACVDHQGGVIDKYVGDEAMALFGAPVAKEDNALCAIKSALEMLNVLKEWNKERAAQGQRAVEMGIGIHTGEVLAGNMGAENRLNYTVIGSNVNLAARICSAAKGMEILISKETLEENNVKQSIHYEEMPPLTLKGFDTSVVLYKILGFKNESPT